MILYQVSYRIFNIGDKLIATTTTPYFLQKQQSGDEWVDTILNSYKPINTPDREFTFFACDAVENCYAFIADKIGVLGNPIYYKIEMQEPVKAVMCITDLILKSGAADINIPDYASEYWTPTLELKYFEYLANEMEIIEIVNGPDVILKNKGKNNYMLDRELRKRTFVK